jgi:hypothetical protein
MKRSNKCRVWGLARCCAASDTSHLWLRSRQGALYHPQAREKIVSDAALRPRKIGPIEAERFADLANRMGVETMTCTDWRQFRKSALLGGSSQLQNLPPDLYAVCRSGIHVWPAISRTLRIPFMLPLLSDFDMAYACEGNGDRFIQKNVVVSYSIELAFIINLRVCLLCSAHGYVHSRRLAFMVVQELFKAWHWYLI